MSQKEAQQLLEEFNKIEGSIKQLEEKRRKILQQLMNRFSVGERSEVGGNLLKRNSEVYDRGTILEESTQQHDFGASWVNEDSNFPEFMHSNPTWNADKKPIQPFDMAESCKTVNFRLSLNEYKDVTPQETAEHQNQKDFKPKLTREEKNLLDQLDSLSQEEFEKLCSFFAVRPKPKKKANQSLKAISSWYKDDKLDEFVLGPFEAPVVSLFLPS